MSFTVRGNRKLAAELLNASDESRDKVVKVLSRGALNVKRDMRRDARSNGSYKHFYRSISYDLDEGELEAEIGPDKNKTQGALGNILYFGTSNNGPVLDINGPLNTEEPKFHQQMRKVVKGLLP